jgi:hypothetical protein
MKFVTEKWVPFNANDKVRVRLTEHGRRLAAEANVPFTEDPGGWSEWQFWWLAHVFGAHMMMGARYLAFETAMQVEVLA